jgi:hypothetical protein
MEQKSKEINLNTIAQPYIGATRSSMRISITHAEQLLSLVKQHGVVAISVPTFNKLIGLCDSIARSWQIKNYLNKHHTAMLKPGTEWFCGQKEKNTVYTFGTRNKNSNDKE